jgi:hypothetical protein
MYDDETLPTDASKIPFSTLLGLMFEYHIWKLAATIAAIELGQTVVANLIGAIIHH